MDFQQGLQILRRWDDLHSRGGCLECMGGKQRDVQFQQSLILKFIVRNILIIPYYSLIFLPFSRSLEISAQQHQKIPFPDIITFPPFFKPFSICFTTLTAFAPKKRQSTLHRKSNRINNTTYFCQFMTIVTLIPNHMYHVWTIIIIGNREEYERWQQQIQMSVKNVTEDGAERNERKSSISTTTCEEDSPDSERNFRALMLPSIRQLRVELFKGDEQGGELSDKVNRKAVSWLMTVCWSKDLGQECLWSAILMYYSLKAQKKVQKETLQITLMTCLSLSIKMFETKSITLKDLTSSSPKPNILQNIIEKQASILEALEYNLIIPHLLTETYNGGLEEEHLFTLMFVCEVLMLKNCAVFFDRERIEKIAEMVVRKSGVQMEGEREICKEVGVILGWKEAKILVNKYSPKFDMDSLRMKLEI